MDLGYREVFFFMNYFSCYIISFVLADYVDLLNASTFLDIQPLLRLMFDRIAALMIELTLDEVKILLILNVI